MDECKFYEGLLNLPLLEVTSVELSKDSILISCCSKLGSAICPCCKNKVTKVNQVYRRKVSDLSISGRSVVLDLEIRQFVCLDCPRHFSEQFDFVSEHSHTTTRQSKWVFMLCQQQAHSQVAALLDMSNSQVAHIYQCEATAHLSSCDRYALVRNLGIDEIALRKGKGDYACVLVDLDRGWVIDILPYRDKDKLIEHFLSKGAAFLQQISHVTCDMWDGYISAAMAVFPNTTIIIDRLHVSMHLNQAIDKQRKELRKEDKDAEELKNTKWILLKNEDDLTTQEKEKLAKVFEYSPVLEELYTIKKTFKAIFDSTLPKAFLLSCITQWVEDAQWIANKYLNEFVKTFNNYKTWICNYFESKLSNGVVEGCNNKIKTIKRIAYGMANFENFKLRILTQTE
jgi:transposase